MLYFCNIYFYDCFFFFAYHERNLSCKLNLYFSLFGSKINCSHIVWMVCSKNNRHHLTWGTRLGHVSSTITTRGRDPNVSSFLIHPMVSFLSLFLEQDVAFVITRRNLNFFSRKCENKTALWCTASREVLFI